MQDAAAHPDPDLLNGLVENSLPEGERGRVLEHLSRCAECREIVSLSAPELPEEQAVAVAAAAGVVAAAAVPVSRSPRIGWLGGAWRWGAVAAGVIVVGTVALVFQTAHKRPGEMAPYAIESKKTPEAAPPNAEKFTADRIQSLPAAPSVAAKDSEPSAGKPQAQAAASSRTPERAQQSRTEAFLKKTPGYDSRANADEGMARSRGTVSGSGFGGEGPPLQARNEGKASVLPAPPPPPPSAVTVSTAPVPSEPVEDQKQSAGAGGNAPAAASETVTVAAVPQAEAPSKIANTNGLNKVATSTPSSTKEVTVDIANESDMTASRSLAKRKVRLGASSMAGMRWKLSPEGALLHSADNGGSWQPAVNPGGNIHWRALSAQGPDLWLGGPAGVLYHSSDAGQHWKEIAPKCEGVLLTADINHLDFPDARHGKLFTANREIWITGDGGQTWEKTSE